MVEQTFNFMGTALPAVPDVNTKVPFRLRLGYAWKSLRGQVHVLGPIDVSNVKDGRYMEGRIRVYLTAKEADLYHLYYNPDVR